MALATLHQGLTERPFVLPVTVITVCFIIDLMRLPSLSHPRHSICPSATLYAPHCDPCPNPPRHPHLHPHPHAHFHPPLPPSSFPPPPPELSVLVTRFFRRIMADPATLLAQHCLARWPYCLRASFASSGHQAGC